MKDTVLIIICKTVISDTCMYHEYFDERRHWKRRKVVLFLYCAVRRSLWYKLYEGKIWYIKEIV